MAAALAAATVLVGGPARADAPDPGATQPPNSIGVRLLDIPTDRADDPRAQSAVVDHLIPGATITRRMEVVSTIPETVDVVVEPENARVADGLFLPAPEVERGLEDWVTIEPPAVTVPAMGAVTVSFTIVVPPSTPTGEYYGAVFAEPPTSGGAIGVRNRVGLRIYLSVGTGDEPPVDFDIGTMTAGRSSDATPYVSTRIRNTGGRALDITGELRLSEGPADLTAGPFPFDGVITLLPGEIMPLRIPLDPELPDGPWRAEIRAYSGLLERTAVGTITFPRDVDVEAEPAETEVTGGTDEDGNDISERLRGQRRALLPLAAIMVLLALGSLWLLLIWKRREDDEEEEQATAEAGAGARDDSG